MLSARRWTSIVLALGSLAPLAARPGEAQEWTGPAAFEVRIEDGKGKPVEGAVVALQTLGVHAHDGPAPLLTDARGRLAVGGLAPGRWALEVRKDGYLTFRAEIAIAFDTKPEILEARQHNVPGALGVMRVRLAKLREAPAAKPALVRAEPPVAPERPAPAATAEKPAPAPPEHAAEPAPAPAREPQMPKPEEPTGRLAPPPTPKTVDRAPAPKPPAATPAPKEEPARGESKSAEAAEVPAPPAPTPPVTPPVERPRPATPPAPVPEPEAAPAPPVAAEPAARPEERATEPPVEPEAAEPAPPVPAPEPAPAPAAKPRATRPVERTCYECRPGESAIFTEVEIAGGGACPADLRARLAATPVEGIGELIAGLPSGCAVLRIDLPRSARYTGFRYEAKAAGESASGDCFPGRDCASGGRFPGEPIVRRDDVGTLVLAVFESSSPTVAGFTAYWSKAR